MPDRVPMTRNGYEMLKQELHKLKTVDRFKNVKDIEEARAHGDISENAEFAAAKEQQARVADRARKIEATFSPENGPPEQMVVTFDGSDPDTYLAVEEADYSAEDLAAFEGTYYCDELDVRYTLRAAEDGLTVEKPGDDFALRAAFASFFTGEEGYLGTEFERDASGAVGAFLLSAGRVRNLRFERLANNEKR